MTRMSRSRRTRTAMLAAIALSAGLLTSVLVAPGGAAVADTPPTPPYPLPDHGYPYMFNESKPTSVAQLKDSPTPTCPAPALPAATDADSPDGYTVPVRIALTNGAMLGGYSQYSAQWGEKLPFSIMASGMTGWIVARVSLPSLQVHIDPADVRICDGGHTYAYQVWPYNVVLPSWNHQTLTQPDGTVYIPYPGSVENALSPLDKLKLNDFVAQQVQAGITGVAADGSLELGTSLTVTGRTVPPPLANGQPDTSFDCQVTIGGTFGTAAESLVTPPNPNFDAVVFPVSGSPAQPITTFPMDMDLLRQPQIYLPTRTLSGAVRGGTGTVGSNWFDVQIPDNSTVPGVGGRCGGTEINGQFYGYDASSTQGVVANGPDDPATGQPMYVIFGSSTPFEKIVPGLTDLSLDVTVDQIGGLPTGLPSGYGFR